MEGVGTCATWQLECGTGVGCTSSVVRLCGLEYGQGQGLQTLRSCKQVITDLHYKVRE